jgi:hypothetical protein
VDIQTVLVAAAAVAAALYLGRGAWRTWAGKGCGGCGVKKKAPAELISTESLLERVRQRGEGQA